MKNSAKAMRQVFVALAGFREWNKTYITLQHDIAEEESDEQRIKRRQQK